MQFLTLNNCSICSSVRRGCQAIIFMRLPGNTLVPLSRRPLLFRFAGSNAKAVLPVLETERTVSHLGAPVDSQPTKYVPVFLFSKLLRPHYFLLNCIGGGECNHQRV
jgi:hypothetical protein